jgi:hypothetical protein
MYLNCSTNKDGMVKHKNLMKVTKRHTSEKDKKEEKCNE